MLTFNDISIRSRSKQWLSIHSQYSVEGFSITIDSKVLQKRTVKLIETRDSLSKKKGSLASWISTPQAGFLLSVGFYCRTSGTYELPSDEQLCGEALAPEDSKRKNFDKQAAQALVAKVHSSTLQLDAQLSSQDRQLKFAARQHEQLTAALTDSEATKDRIEMSYQTLRKINRLRGLKAVGIAVVLERMPGTCNEHT